MASTGIIYVAYDDVDGRPHINIYNTDTVDPEDNIDLIRTLDFSYLDDWGLYSICIDESGNIFFQGYHKEEGEDKLWKIDSLGNIIASVICPEAEPLCDITVSPEGYLYTNDRYDRRVNKRDPGTLAEIDYIATGFEHFEGLAFHSNTGFFVGNYGDEYIEKWDFVDGFVQKRHLDRVLMTEEDLAISGEVLLGFQWKDDPWTSPFDLDEDATIWSVDGMSRMRGVGVLNNEDFLLAGEAVNNGAQFLARYTPAKVLVWKEEILDAYNVVMQVKAYPFEAVSVEPPIIWDPHWKVESIMELPDYLPFDYPPYAPPEIPPWDINLPELPPWVYWDFPDLPPLPPWYLPELPEWEIPDYPPMSFVGDLYLNRLYTEKDVEELRQKCIIYEENYNSLCLVVNHNTTVIKNWLYENYNGEPMGESEKFFEIFPSQQLTALHSKSLELNDFKEIINRFINIDSSNARNLNHNFNLYTEWINDYNYDEDGYKAEHVSVEEKIITDNNPTVNYLKNKVDRLSQEILGATIAIKHNFDLIKEITQEGV